MMPRQDHSGRRFESTHWSIVTRVDVTRTADAHGALVELCMRYRFPVYAYVRGCGHAPAVARDVTRAFMQHLFEHFREEGVACAQGQFRDYLLSRLRTFLAGDWRSAVNGEVIEELAAPPAAELELRYQQDIAPGASPEDAYRRSFALEVLSRAFARLRDEACETDHLDMYDALEPFMALDPTPGQQESLASRLHSRPLALIVALKRLRQRFRELVDAELADLVASPAEMLAEQHALHAVLRVRR